MDFPYQSRLGMVDEGNHEYLLVLSTVENLNNVSTVFNSLTQTSLSWKVQLIQKTCSLLKHAGNEVITKTENIVFQTSPQHNNYVN